MTKSSSFHAQHSSLERVLLGVLLAIALALSWFEYRSATAAAMRRGSAIAVLLSFRETSTDSSATPAQYLLLYHTRQRTLDLIYVSDISILEEFSGQISWILPISIAQDFAPPAPERIRDWLLSQPQGFRFWWRWPRVITRLRRQTIPPAPAYDILLLALETFRLRPKAIHLRWLSSTREDLVFLRQLWASEPEPRTPSPVTVEIFNASGQTGVALQATKVLRLRGLDVMDFGNAPTEVERTQFLDRAGCFDAAVQAAKTLGCSQAAVMTRLDLRRPAIVTAVLGRDFAQCTELFVQK